MHEEADTLRHLLRVRMCNRLLEYTPGYWNYTVDEQSTFVLFRCWEMYNDMRLDYQQVIQ